MLVYSGYLYIYNYIAKTVEVPIVVRSILIVGVLTFHALLHSTCDLKAAQMNMQCDLIWESMLFKFKLGHDAMEASKSICYVQSEDTVDHSTVIRI